MIREKTFVMIKPGAVQRGLIGEILSRFENKGLSIVSIKIINVSIEQAKEHYIEHKNKNFYQDLVEYIMSGPCVALIISGDKSVELVRHMAGSTNPLVAELGTIRGDYSSDIENNIIHTSDSIENARREINIYFDKKEMLDYIKVTDKWSFNPHEEY